MVAVFQPVVHVELAGCPEALVVETHEAESFPQVLFELMQSVELVRQRRPAFLARGNKKHLIPTVC
jgi:hypothetical protein